MNDYRYIDFVEYGVTNLHPLAIVFMLCMLALTLAPRRSGVLLALVMVCVFMPMEQRVVIGGLDFGMLRLIMLAAWARVSVKGEYRGLQLNRLDHLVLLWVVSASLFYVLRVGPSGIPYRLGISFDALSAFFLMRVLVRRPSEAFVLWRYIAWAVLVLSPLMVFESVADHNIFGMFNYDGSTEVVLRDGKVRSQGPWTHPILAGTFGAVVVPVFVAMFLGSKTQRRLFALACIGATAITITARSSGSLIAWAIGVFGWAIWRYRRHMRLMLWSAFGMAVVIHFAREKPFWHLILRLSQIVGGTGYHRYYLIDAFINRFGEWALVGTDNTANWGWGLQDTTSQYVAEGISGGLVTFILFILILRTSFVQLRLSREELERGTGPKSPWALLAWGSSVSLAAHCASFVSVSYFGQIFQFFFFFVGTIPAFAAFKRIRHVKSAARRRVASPRESPGFVSGGS